MTNEEYVRRVVRIQDRIYRMFPDPPGDWDSNQYEHERVYYARKRALARIYSLPERWQKLAKRCERCQQAPCIQTEDCPGGRHYERQMARQGHPIG